MPTPRRTVTLDHDLAERIGGEVTAGRFDSIESYLDEAANRMLDEASLVEDWLRKSLVAGHEEYLADPGAAVPADRIMPRLRAARSER